MRKTLSFVLAALLATQNAWALKVNGQLQNAVLEKKASAPAGVEGQIYYNTTSKKAQIHNGTAFADVGSGGGGGGINYVSANADAEVDTSGYSTYADAAGASPVDGTGGSPSITWTRSTSSPLRGTASFILTKGASNLQGQGVSYAFTMDSADAIHPQMQRISFDYSAGGSFHYGSNQVSDISDVTVYVYDVTAGTLIQPSTFIVDGSGHYSGEFQPTYNSTSYRLILHTATTNSSAWTFKVDNVAVGPGTKVKGAPVTDWQSYTPTIAGLGTGSVASATADYRRVGDSLEVMFTFQKDGSNGTGGANVTVSLPSGLSIDTSKNSSGVATATIYGNAIKGGGTTYAVSNNSTATVFNAGMLGSDVTTGLYVMGRATIPILGWSSNTAMSADTGDSRVVTAVYQASSGQTFSHNSTTKITFDTKIIDDLSAFVTDTYTVKVPGKYRVSTNFRVTPTSYSGVGNQVNITLYKNGSGYADLDLFQPGSTSTSDRFLSGSQIVNCVAGDTLDLRLFQNTGANVTGGSTTQGQVSFERISGPQTIAASETVAAYYTGSPPTGTLSGAYNLVTYGTKVKDSHGAYSSGTWTAPASGVYSITASILATGTYALNNQVSVHIYVNGSNKASHTNKAGGAVSYAQALVSLAAYPLMAGDTVKVYSYCDATGPAFGAGADNNYFTITRVGNY